MFRPDFSQAASSPFSLLFAAAAARRHILFLLVDDVGSGSSGDVIARNLSKLASAVQCTGAIHGHYRERNIEQGNHQCLSKQLTQLSLMVAYFLPFAKQTREAWDNIRHCQR